MATLASAAGPLSALAAGAARSWPILAGLLVLYVPTYRDLATNVWPDPENAHGVVVLAVIAWLVWNARDRLASAEPSPHPLTGWLLLLAGLLAYVVGRALGIVILEVGSQLPVVAGLILITRGPATLGMLRFPFILALFMIPLPEILINALTSPLKQQVSAVVAHLLGTAGYAIGREGVILVVGQYQLMVADACSGLGSMFSLSALGLVYLHLAGHASRVRNALLLASIVPIAFIANIIRVTALALITFHLGEAAGQGFMHGMAGMLLFVVALLSLIGLDGVLGWLLRKPTVRETTP
ncbi:MAG: exosortase B [Burkholderiales bacterium]